MKIAKIILLALTTCLVSCYEDYTHDYETTNVGFALQNHCVQLYQTVICLYMWEYH